MARQISDAIDENSFTDDMVQFHWSFILEENTINESSLTHRSFLTYCDIYE